MPRRSDRPDDAPALREQEAQAAHLLQSLTRHVPGVIYQYRLYADGRSCVPFASEGLRHQFGLAPESVRADATPFFERVHPDDAERFRASIVDSARSLGPWDLEFRLVLPEHGVRWAHGRGQPEREADGSVIWHGFITDITRRKQIEEQTRRLAYFDTLTELPNRRLFGERLTQALTASRRHAGYGALLCIDLDNFKQINDARGHAVGDRLLCEVAARLSRALRREDVVARLGGDEFVVLAAPLGGELDAAARQAAVLADKLRELLARPCVFDGVRYSGAGSIGVTLFPKAQETAEDLLREADIAMHRAKAAGRNRVAFFESAMQSEVEERLALEQDLRRALVAGGLEVHVQTQFDAHGHELGGELLLRWSDARRGPVSPARFIPVAEESGLIIALGDFVLRRACQALARLQRAGQRRQLSVNVSPRQFRQEGFVARVREILRETRAIAGDLVLEVTEGLLIDDWQTTLARMQELVALGVRFSIDDFGTGYSSLAYLKKLPLYELKIDRSFVADVPGDASDVVIVQAILSVARHLGLHVVGEGVETQAQADFLRQHGCHAVQGYLFARPQPLAQWLDARLAGVTASAG